MLGVPGDALAAKRFEEIARHFDEVDTSAGQPAVCRVARWMLVRDPVLPPRDRQVSALAARLRSAEVRHTAHQHRCFAGNRLQHLNRSEIHVDELDADNRVRLPLRHRCRLGNGGIHRFRDRHASIRTRVPAASHRRRGQTCSTEDVWDNLIVRVTDGEGRVAAATHDEPGQADAADRSLRLRVPGP